MPLNRRRQRRNLLRHTASAVLMTLLLAGVVTTVVRAQSLAPPSVPAPGVAEPSTTIPSKNLWDVIKAGGILMIPIGFCSVLTTVFVFERLLALRKGRVVPKPFIKRFLHQLIDGQLDRE